ncbi:unnamed protein product [Camellia sinensis]
MDKELQQCTEMSSQVKRRRMLQFDNEILGSPLCNEEISSVFLKSKVCASLFPRGKCYMIHLLLFLGKNST